MNNFNLTPMTDMELMNLAKKRVNLKKGFKGHLASYLLVNIFLVFIFFISSSGYFWPMWPILGWGLGVAFHGIAVSIELSDTTSSNKVIDEYKWLKRAAESEANGDYNKQEQKSNRN